MPDELYRPNFGFLFLFLAVTNANMNESLTSINVRLIVTDVRMLKLY